MHDGKICQLDGQTDMDDPESGDRFRQTLKDINKDMNKDMEMWFETKFGYKPRRNEKALLKSN